MRDGMRTITLFHLSYDPISQFTLRGLKNRLTQIEKRGEIFMQNMTITEELKAIQAGTLPCSEHKLAVCVAYCERRLKAMRELMDADSPKQAIAAHLIGAQSKIDFYAGFIAWAEKQTGGAQ